MGRAMRQGGRKPGNLLRSLLAAAAMFLALGGFLQIRNVQITGNVLYSEKQIRDAAAVPYGRSLLLTPCRELSRRIESAFSAVEAAEVSLAFPDTLLIHIREGAAVAALPCEGRYLLLSSGCKVLRESASGEGLIRIVGLDADGAEVGKRLQLAEAAKVSYLSRLLPLLEEYDRLQSVGEIDLSNIASLRMSYAGRFQIRLGDQEQLGEKIDFLDRIISSLSHGETGIIDLTKGQEGHFIPD